MLYSNLSFLSFLNNNELKDVQITFKDPGPTLAADLMMNVAQMARDGYVKDYRVESSAEGTVVYFSCTAEQTDPPADLG